jgi:Fe-S cluster biogenesis protein NfuA
MSSEMTKTKKVQLIKLALKEVEPALQMHGGGVKYIDLTDEGVVRLQLQGHCSGCAYSIVTLKMGIEKVLMERLPNIVTGVEEA